MNFTKFLRTPFLQNTSGFWQFSNQALNYFSYLVSLYHQNSAFDEWIKKKKKKTTSKQRPKSKWQKEFYWSIFVIFLSSGYFGWHFDILKTVTGLTTWRIIIRVSEGKLICLDRFYFIIAIKLFVIDFCWCATNISHVELKVLMNRILNVYTNLFI